MQREDSLMMLYLNYKDCKQLKVQAQLKLGAKADQLKNLEAALEKNLRSLESTKSRLAKNESNKVKKARCHQFLQYNSELFSKIN